MPVSDIVDVQVVLESLGPTRPSFSTPLLLAAHSFWPQRLREFSRTSELVEAGVPENHPLMQMASELKAQPNSPRKFIVGRRTRLPTQVIHLAPLNVKSDFVYEFSYVDPDGEETLVEIVVEDTTLSKTITAVFGTDTISTSTPHGLTEDAPVQFVGGDLPAPLVAATTYYVIAAGLTSTSFRVSATEGGAVLDLTDNGTGAMSVTGGANVATIVDAIADQLSAIAGAEAVATAGTHVILTGAVAGALFDLRGMPGPQDLLVTDASLDPGITSDLNDCEQAENPESNWYGILTDTTSTAEAEAIAAWVASRRRVAFLNTVDGDNADAAETDSVGRTLKALGRKRSPLLYSANRLLGQQSSAWVGKKLGADAGATIWSGVALEGIRPDNLKSSDVTGLKTANVNFYTLIAGKGYVQEGKAPDGGYLDNLIGLDWFQSQLELDLFAAINLASERNEKIAFTQEGIDIVVGVLGGTFARASKRPNTLLVPAGKVGGWRIVAPKIDQINSTDKGNRVLKGVEGFGTLQGAIERVEFRVFVAF